MLVMADLECTHEDSETRCQGFRKDSLQLKCLLSAEKGGEHNPQIVPVMKLISG
jgi:hypothetical protein